MIIITTSRKTIKISKHKARVAGWRSQVAGLKWSLEARNLVMDGTTDPMVVSANDHRFLLLWLKPDLWNPIVWEIDLWKLKSEDLKRRKRGCEDLRLKTGEKPKKRVKREAVKSEMWVKGYLLRFFVDGRWVVGVSVCVWMGGGCVSVSLSVSALYFSPLCVWVFWFFFFFSIAKSNRIFGSDRVKPNSTTIWSGWRN